MVEERKRVLIVAYLFPPIGGIGVQRALKFAKYLVGHGFAPIVLTTHDAVSATMDAQLLEQVPKEVQIVRVRDPIVRIMKRAVQATAGAPTAPATSSSTVSKATRTSLKGTIKTSLKQWKDRLLIPDEQSFWALRAAVTAARIIREQGISCVYTTSPPASSHIVGLLAKRWTGVKWVADFRDPWTDNMHFQGEGRRAGIERWLERRVLLEADRVATVTNSFSELFAKKEPAVARKIRVIRNGVDPADFPPLTPAPKTGKLTMLYAGILYPKRSPEPFLRALAKAIEKGRVRRDEISIEFAGVFDYPGYSTNHDLVRELHLEEVVQILGYLRHDEVAKRMANAQSLLLIGDTDPSAHMYIPGKLYEYLFTQRPIFGLMLPGEAASLIEQYDAGYVVSPEHLDDVEEAIVQVVNAFREGRLTEKTRPVVQELTRPYQAEQLADLLNEMTNKHASAHSALQPSGAVSS